MSTEESLYFQLFNAITDAIRALDDHNYGLARAALVTAQQRSEECYISREDDETP